MQQKLARLLAAIVFCSLFSSCGSTKPPAGLAAIGPIRRAGGLLPPSTEFGRPAVPVMIDGVSRQGPAWVKISPGPHTVRLTAPNLNTLEQVTADLTFEAKPGIGYATRCRSVGDKVEFQIVDVNVPEVVVARAMDSAPSTAPRKEMDLLMAPLVRLFTDDR